FLALRQRQRLGCQLTNDFMEQLGVKDAASFAERTQGDAVTSEERLHFVQLAGLLDAPQAPDGGIEEEQEEQAGILVEVQAPIAGPVACAGIVMQMVEQGTKDLEILQTLKILGCNRGFGFGRHWLSPEPDCQ